MHLLFMKDDACRSNYFFHKHSLYNLFMFYYFRERLRKFFTKRVAIQDTSGQLVFFDRLFLNQIWKYC